MGFDAHGGEAHGVPLSSNGVLPREQLSAQCIFLRGAFGITRGRGQVVMFGVVAKRTSNRKLRRELSTYSRGYGSAIWTACLVVPLIEIWDYLPLQQGVHRFGFQGVPCGIFAMFLAVADGPSDLGE